jgi:release factor glutamine methyltransferase
VRVAEALAVARALGVERLDAQLLLANRLQRDRTWLIAHDDHELGDAAEAAVRADFGRRAAGVPLAYLTGEREFHGLAFTVTHDVLVPRPETEGLVDWAIDLLRARVGQSAAAADLGTGSGAIALAVRARCPWVDMTATDFSAAALQVARANAARLGLEVDFVEGAWYEPLRGRRFELLLSNPPYIAGDDPHLAALVHEPRQALTPEGDGLAALRALAAGARQHLQHGGWLLVEHGHDQAEAVAALLRDAGLLEVTLRRDLAGLPRVSGARAA